MCQMELEPRANRMYCSAACRQKAYRHRLSYQLARHRRKVRRRLRRMRERQQVTAQ